MVVTQIMCPNIQLIPENMRRPFSFHIPFILIQDLPTGSLPALFAGSGPDPHIALHPIDEANFSADARVLIVDKAGCLLPILVVIFRAPENEIFGNVS